jgi:hypothetical protein
VAELLARLQVMPGFLWARNEVKEWHCAAHSVASHVRCGLVWIHTKFVQSRPVRVVIKSHHFCPISLEKDMEQTPYSSLLIEAVKGPSGCLWNLDVAVGIQTTFELGFGFE